MKVDSTVTNLVAVAVMGTFVLAGCGGQAVRDASSDDDSHQWPIKQWQTQHHTDHPLVGKVWSSGAGEFVEMDAVREKLEAATLILLGERHDNPDHHRIQAVLIGQTPSPSLVGFEMLDEDDVAAIAASNTPDELAEKSRWDSSGWPPFVQYKPVFTAVFKHGLKPVAALPNRARLRTIMMPPKSEPPSELPSVLSEDGLASLQQDIKVGHCGYAPPAMLNGMVRGQVFKDHWMAKKVTPTPGMGRRVLVAGNGHVRRDYGVPNHVAGERLLVIGLLEVIPGRPDPSEYAPERFDVIFFTPRVDTDDPCEKFKKALEKMKKSHHSTKLKTDQPHGKEPEASTPSEGGATHGAQDKPRE